MTNDASPDAGDFSIDGARRASEQGALDRWVLEFLASPGSDNEELGEQLTERQRWWIGPLRVPIGSLHRLVGPPGDPVLCPVDDDDAWRDDVAEMAERIDDGQWAPAPVIVMRRDDQLVLEDGNHRVEALRRAGDDSAWAVIGFESPEDRDAFEPPT